jgi:hypothetical protein
MHGRFVENHQVKKRSEMPKEKPPIVKKLTLKFLSIQAKKRVA